MLEPCHSFIIVNATDETLDQFEASANHGIDLFQDQFFNARCINLGSLLCSVTMNTESDTRCCLILYSYIYNSCILKVVDDELDQLELCNTLFSQRNKILEINYLNK
jgi:hypothetical protein